MANANATLDDAFDPEFLEKGFVSIQNVTSVRTWNQSVIDPIMGAVNSALSRAEVRTRFTMTQLTY